MTPETSTPESVMPEKTSYAVPTAANSVASRGMTLKEVPTEALGALAAEHTHVVVDVKRRNNRGQLASLGFTGVMMTPAEVANIASWIEPRAGGGVYAVTVASVKNTLQRLLPTFEVVLEGAPRAPMSLHQPAFASAPNPYGGLPAPHYDINATIPGAMSPADIPLIPGLNDMPRPQMDWMQGLHPQERAMYEARIAQQQRMHPSVQLPPGASLASDQLAMDQLRRAEARSAELDARLAAQMQRQEERERALSEQLREQSERSREELHKVQLDMMQKQIAMAAAAKDETPKVTIADYAPLLAAAAPLIAAMITSSREAASEAAKVQQAGMQQIMALMAEQSKRPVADPLDAVTKLAPLFQATQKDPAANAAILETMGNLQLQNMGMMAQMIETMGGGHSDSPPVWLPVVQQIAGGLIQMSQAMAADSSRQIMQAAAPPPQMVRQMPSPQQPQPQPQPQPRPPQRSNDVPYQTVDKPLKITPAMLDLLPEAFRTPEWKGIIIGLHDMRDPAEIGTMLARHIGHLNEFTMLPPVLTDFHVDPPNALRRLVSPLPIFTSNRPYVEQVVNATVQALFDEGVLSLAEPSDEDENEAEAAQGEEQEHEAEEEEAEAPVSAREEIIEAQGEAVPVSAE